MCPLDTHRSLVFCLDPATKVAHCPTFLYSFLPQRIYVRGRWSGSILWSDLRQNVGSAQKWNHTITFSARQVKLEKEGFRKAKDKDAIFSVKSSILVSLSCPFCSSRRCLSQWHRNREEEEDGKKCQYVVCVCGNRVHWLLCFKLPSPVFTASFAVL